MKNWILSIVVVVFTTTIVSAQDISIGERFEISSKTLGEQREYIVHLPPSYYHSEKSHYPVIYLLDGEYNFSYVSGLLDQMSFISGQIPEMILVGISDKGTEKYRKNMTPEMEDDLFNDKSGNSNSFSLFLEKELQVIINSSFRTLPYEILIGHSLGGLFTLNCLLKTPEHFDAYIAISPSLWVNDKILEAQADSLLLKNKDFNKSVFISLANESQMGVYSFIDLLDFSAPSELDWKFKRYENENHNSVGIISIRDGLLDLFKDYEITKEQFIAFEDASDVTKSVKKYNEMLGGEINFPEILIGNMLSSYTQENNVEQIKLLETEITEHFPNSLELYYNVVALYQLAGGEIDKAYDTYHSHLKDFPYSYRFNQGLSKVHAAKGERDMAIKRMRKAIDLAKNQNTAQWMINILKAELESIQ